MATFRPGKPHVRLVLTANRALGAGSQLVAWDAAAEENPVIWAPATPTDYVLDRDGLWLVVFQAMRAPTAVTSPYDIRVLAVGETPPQRGRTVTATTVARTAHNVVVLEQFAAGTTIQAQVVNGATGNQYDVNTTALSITRVGPKRWV